jgi:hypothetical protein
MATSGDASAVALAVALALGVQGLAPDALFLGLPRNN